MTLITWMFFSPFSFSLSASERIAETWGLLILSLRFNVWHFWSSCFMNQHSGSIYWTSIICRTLCWETRMLWFNRHLSVRSLQSSRGARWYLTEQKCKCMHLQIDALGRETTEWDGNWESELLQMRWWGGQWAHWSEPGHIPRLAMSMSQDPGRNGDFLAFPSFPSHYSEILGVGIWVLHQSLQNVDRC